MNKTIAVIVVVLVVVGGAYYLFAKNSSGTAPAAPTASTSEVASATVSIQNFSFNPASLSVKTGTKVTWTNNDSVAHTITSDSGGLLASQTLSP